MTAPQDHTAAFPLTRWSLVLSSLGENDAAFEALCRLYWSPLYVFCRRSGLGIEDAEDVTQRFFHDLLKNRAVLLADASPDAGRLRTLFLRVLQRRIADHHRHNLREKRGGGQVVSLDTEAAEADLCAMSADATPEQASDRQWALTASAATSGTTSPRPSPEQNSKPSKPPCGLCRHSNIPLHPHGPNR